MMQCQLNGTVLPTAAFIFYTDERLLLRSKLHDYALACTILLGPSYPSYLVSGQLSTSVHYHARHAAYGS